MLELHQFQKQIIYDTKKTMSEGATAPLIVSPTGSGKTIIFSHIAQGAMKKDKRVLILTHRKEILRQTLSKLFGFGVQSGQIVSGMPMTRDKCQVAMIGTLVNRVDKIKRPDLIIIDECHHAVANQWKKVINFFSDVPRLGFTATPERADGTGLIDVFDTMIKGPSLAQLVADGFLSYPVMYKPPHEITQKFHIKRGDFDKDEQQQAMTKKTIIGDVLEHYRRYLDHQPVVCYCVSLEHCRIMTQVFKDAGYRAEMVWGNMNEKDRDRAIYGLADGSIEIVTSCDVISEGVDIPVMAGCIMLRRTTSLSLYLQQAGRALRIYPGKDRAVILDHSGNYYIHGHILADRDWSLDHGKRNHKKDKPPTTTGCPKCSGVWPGTPRICPGILPSGERCGFQFSTNPNIAGQQRKTPHQIAGELVAALPGDVSDLKVNDLAKFVNQMQSVDPKLRQKAMISKAFQLSNKGEIQALSQAVGYKPGWTDWFWKNMYQKKRA